MIFLRFGYFFYYSPYWIFSNKDSRMATRFKVNIKLWILIDYYHSPDRSSNLQIQTSEVWLSLSDTPYLVFLILFLPVSGENSVLFEEMPNPSKPKLHPKFLRLKPIISTISAVTFPFPQTRLILLNELTQEWTKHTANGTV